ncbi:MAG TPA: ABC transporter ATP-binding protein [Candidatus Alectryocaccomicrobium excrementavium]|uniref:ABC transporter ATP-binding protein n=1 Tax=Candidatus Alectryocaccomicrobium excrementavium TaxID=2840668 RepID=A0A9D1G2U2_9FIRM|nr:ABC transporter ATP-binding protein [Candidatus Alectryocaccomicrobium excrementavium]
MGTILSRVKLQGKHVAALLILMLLSAVSAMLLPTALASMIDTGVAGENRSAILIIAAVMAVLSLLGCLFSVAATVLSARISTNFAASLRREIFHQVQSFSAAEMDRFGTASLVARSTSDVTNVQMFLSLLLRLGVTAPLMAVAGLVLSSLTGGELSSVLNIAIPALILGAGVIVLLVSRYSITLRQRIDQLNKRFLETLEGVRVIRAFNQQAREIQRFEEANGDLTATAILSGRVSALLMPVIQVIFGVTTAAVMGMGAWYVSQGEMDVGALVANSQYISMILAAIMMLALVIMLFPMSYACARRIAEVLNTTSSIQSGSHSAEERPERACVVFDHVTFAYPGADEPVLRDISFESRAGEVTAIIGRTGCGKSSVLKLIPRLYDATLGHISVDGMDVKKYSLQELRALIGYIPQKNVLFSGDVASNLRFGAQESSEAQWQEAAHIACADEFIEQKPGGYHAEIAQGGTNLSGGQRQRMAIARAVVKKPEIYLFDDSFSALDMKTDRTLRARLRESIGNSTMILVAQRVGSIIDADRILVMEDGQIVGRGTHRELLRTCPLYREIAELQLGEEEVQHEMERV